MLNSENNPVDLPQIKSFFSFLEEKDYINDILSKLANGLVVCIEWIKDCNRSECFYALNESQLTEIVNFLFEKQKKKAEEFAEYCKNNVVYDGMIFGATSKLLEKAKETNKTNAKLSYLLCFNFMCEGFVMNFIEKSQNRFSTYEFKLT